MIICLENYNGENIGYFRVIEFNENGESKLTDIAGDISYADKEIDTYFNTNETMFRIQLEDKINK